MTYSPLFEWRSAAKWAGYSWEAFVDLDGDEQAWIVAHYRCTLQLEAVLTHYGRKRERPVSKRK